MTTRVAYPRGVAAHTPRSECPDVREFGAKPGDPDSSAQIQAALDCGATEVTLGDTGWFKAAVTIPADVTLRTAGAVLKPVPSSTATYIVRTGGVGASIVGISFDFSSEGALVGGERAVQIRHDNATVDRCRFTGTGYRWGVLIQGSGSDTCHDASITRCRFLNTSYGVLKQGSTGTRSDNIEIVGNRFQGISRGDAIELNVGGDYGHIIERNWIGNVTANGAVNAGIGIGVAGDGIDPTDIETYQRAFTIVGNLITNVEFESIHVEVGAYFEIERNNLDQRGTYAGTGKGIATYGCQYGNIKHNTVRDFATGIFDDPPVVGGSYVAATTGQIIESNDVSGCTTRGIWIGVAGERLSCTARKNRVRDCTIGIDQNGAASVILDDNQLVDCDTPLQVNMDPGPKASIAATYSRILHATANKAYRNGLPQPLGNSIGGISAAIVYERGNNFLVATAGDIADHHLPGDIVIVGATAKACLTPGWTQKDPAAYYFTAAAGNNYVVIVSPGDPAVAFKAGQMVSLPGAGVAGAALTGYIQRIYVASSEYRVEISTTIATSVGSSTVMSLAQTATYATLT